MLDPLDEIRSICDEQPHDALTQIARVLGFGVPTEPVKVDAEASVLSDAAILEVWQPYRDLPVDWICQFARALLASYGNIKQEK